MISPPQFPSNHVPVLRLPGSDSRCEIQVPLDHIRYWNIPGPIADARELETALVAIVSDIGHLIRISRQFIEVSSKDSNNDFVTNVDIGVEMLLREWLRVARPMDKVIGEERGHMPFDFDDVTWFLDPIDGTSNYISGAGDVAIHVGSICRGFPWISVVGLPFDNMVYSPHSQRLPYQGTRDSTIVIGTEYRNDGSKEHHTLSTIQSTLSAVSLRKKSIGVNVLNLIDGSATLFYKPKAKFWDVIAPLGLAYQWEPDRYRMTLTYDAQSTTRTVPLFGFGADIIPYLNYRHTVNSRIGLICVVPIDRPDLEAVIIREVMQCMSLSC